MEVADRKLQEAEQALSEAEMAYLKQLETEAADLRRTSDGIKDFIKKTVISGQVKKKEEEVNALEAALEGRTRNLEEMIKAENTKSRRMSGEAKTGPEEDAGALTGQMISVENSRLGLSPLELKPDVREEPPAEPEKPVYTEHDVPARQQTAPGLKS